MLMTIFGIAGCMALLVTGFGLKDSNTGMVEKQFDKLWKYETMVVFGDNPTEAEIEKYNETLKELPGYFIFIDLTLIKVYKICIIISFLPKDFFII